MPLLISYSFKNILARKLTSGLTVFGLALVVFVFCAVMMLANGLNKTLVSTGYDDNAIVIADKGIFRRLSELHQVEHIRLKLMAFLENDRRNKFNGGRR